MEVSALGNGGGREEKRYSLFKPQTTFYPPAPLVATLEDTTKISHSLSWLLAFVLRVSPSIVFTVVFHLGSRGWVHSIVGQLGLVRISQVHIHGIPQILPRDPR